MSVSIHAPAWGATGPSPTDDQLMQFQSTLPRGERQGRPWLLSAGGCFNPRSRVGSDFTYCFDYLFYKVSIHAPAWGATDNN